VGFSLRIAKNGSFMKVGVELEVVTSENFDAI